MFPYTTHKAANPSAVIVCQHEDVPQAVAVIVGKQYCHGSIVAKKEHTVLRLFGY